MVKKSFIFAFLLLPQFCVAAESMGTCIGNVAAAKLNVAVQSPNGAPIPLHKLNRLPAGYKIQYQPILLPFENKDKARVALVLAPSASESASNVLTLMESHPAAETAEWSAPFRTSLVILILGPQGLDEKRVTALMNKEQDLVGPLADYADQTEELEEMISVLESGTDEEAGVREAAGTRVVSYMDQGHAVTTEQMLTSILRVLNPMVFASNPLGAGRRTMPATLAGRAASGFFENAGDFVPGGGILPSVKTWLFPDTEFRATFAQPTGNRGMNLCVQRQSVRTRNRIAYLWAHRLVDSDAPVLALPAVTHLPVGLQSAFPVSVGKPADWNLLPHIQAWTLESAQTGNSVPVPVKPAANINALEIDLRKTAVPPGAYRLKGQWDWNRVELKGEMRLYPPADLEKAMISPPGGERLIEARGRVPVRLTGANFQFVERMALINSASGEKLRTLYPSPKIDSQSGPRESIDFELDTTGLAAGTYAIELVQAGGKSQEIPLQIAPQPPRIDNLPLRVNLGENEQKILIRGQGLSSIQSIEAEGAVLRLEAADPALSQDNEREISVRIQPGLKAGARIALNLKLRDDLGSFKLADALVVAGPRPKITGMKASLPGDLAVALREGELPAGSFTGFMLMVDNLEERISLRLRCSEPERTIRMEAIQAGENREFVRLEASERGSLFLSLDPGAFGRNGCGLAAEVETPGAGRSDPFPLGRVLRFPRVESMTLTDEKLGEGIFAAVVRGQDLELIDKTGWESGKGLSVPGLPNTQAGQGQTQILKVAIPWPSPTPRSPLYIWLRGETDGRLTKIK